MKSGLGDRNNTSALSSAASARSRLNEVRPWRPEQLCGLPGGYRTSFVSMKSGLGDRNNTAMAAPCSWNHEPGLNEVRSWRPEQSRSAGQKKVGLTASQ